LSLTNFCASVNFVGMSQTGEREGRLVAAIPEDTYGRRLMLARDHAGHLSIREAAERCGLNHASWANWERGMASRTILYDADAIAEGLSVNRDWLLYGGPLTAQVRTRATRVRHNDGYGRTVRRPVGHPTSHARTGQVRRPQRIDRRAAA
jgi:hypothetical protein